jgi:hypothetical protein
MHHNHVIGYKKLPVTDRWQECISMSRGSGSSFITVAVFLAILLIVLPAGADNVTTDVTTVAPDVTTVAINETTAAPTQTTVPPAETTVAPTQTTLPATQTPVLTTQTSAAPPVTTVAVTLPTTVITPEKPTTGIVIVHSSPAGASILIDGFYSGTTPRTIEGVPGGNHILRLSLSGYNDYEGSIYVVPGQIAQGYGTLQPLNPGTAVVSAPPVVTVIVPVVAVTPKPPEDAGLLANSGVIAAIIGAISVIIISAAKIFTHVRPPKKEE